ncbi:cysteine protease StiP family protein [Ectobacillus panaciterrae]|uniref:cysteine protease StiP family protein n=1 Tax=Ectobacillus panaciterrae TaxID=363872 RepID=UPI0003F6422A
MAFTTSLPTLMPVGSYLQEDVTFLLKDLSSSMLESSTEERERAIQSGTHYSEMLPVEYKPSEEYMKLFHSSLEMYKKKLAVAVGVVAEQIIENKGTETVLVSLARAGTPIGILIKRYILATHGLSLPHYSVSIIRGRGIDENAMQYIFQNHPNQRIQFIDGWTGKGAITKELQQAVARLNEIYNQQLDACIAVLADPGHCAAIFGTREDFLIPSACLNATVSGLVSRTILNKLYIGSDDFHGVKYYRELEGEDVSNHFINTIAKQFPLVQNEISTELGLLRAVFSKPTWSGLQEVERIQKEFGIENMNLVKPGVGETTRVLLRRVPWKVLVSNYDDPNLHHILLLAKERNVPVELYPRMSYSCCGLIKSLGGNTE